MSHSNQAYKPPRKRFNRLRYYYAQMTEMFRDKTSEHYEYRIITSNVRIAELESSVKRLALNLESERKRHDKILKLYREKF